MFHTRQISRETGIRVSFFFFVSSSCLKNVFLQKKKLGVENTTTTVTTPFRRPNSEFVGSRPICSVPVAALIIRGFASSPGASSCSSIGSAPLAVSMMENRKKKDASGIGIGIDLGVHFFALCDSNHLSGHSFCSVGLKDAAGIEMVADGEKRLFFSCVSCELKRTWESKVFIFCRLLRTRNSHWRCRKTSSKLKSAEHFFRPEAHDRTHI